MDSDSVEAESCTVEELMDQEVPQPAQQKPAESLPGSELRLDWIPSSSAVWVLDTNVLLHTLEHIQALCKAQLHELSHNLVSFPRIYLVVPFVVLEELDHLKLTNKQDNGTHVAASSRSASHWILSTVQLQKYMRTISQDALHPHRWVLHVQTMLSVPSRDLTNDLTIVALCAELLRSCQAQVMLISDDTNARTHAEIMNIASISLPRVLQTIRKAAGSSSLHNEVQQLFFLSLPENRHLLTQS